MALLEVSELTVRFGRRRRVAVDRLSFVIERGGRLGLIGESGSGKTVTALAIMGLLPETAEVSGSIRLAGRELVGLPDREVARLRGAAMSMVFQEPMTALDPTMIVGRQVAEVLTLHSDLTRAERRTRVVSMLAEVGLAEPTRVANSFPHQLSGGQRQRCLMAMALIETPSLVICDEPTTALDATVQAHLLTTLDSSLARAEAACLFISHDLAVVAQVCDHVLVMRDGAVVETGELSQILRQPRSDYTAALLAATRLDEAPPGSLLPVFGEVT